MSTPAALILAGTTAAYLAAWFAGIRRQGQGWRVGDFEFSADRILGLALVLHTLFLFVHAAIEQRCPTSHSYEAIIFLCWCISLVYFLVNFSFTVPWLSKYVTPVIIVLFIAAFYGVLSAPVTKPGSTGWRVTLHVVSLFAAYSLMLVSCITGVLYLKKEKALKARLLDHRLPPLEILEKMSLWTLTVGFPIMTFGMFMGMLLAQADTRAGGWLPDKRVVFVSLSWLIYGLVLHLRLLSFHRGRRVVILTVAGFGFMMLALLGTQWHTFGIN